MSTHRIQEVALALGVLGSLIIAYGAAVMVVANRRYEGPTHQNRIREKWAHLIGSLLVAIAFGGFLYAIHGH